MRIIAVLPAGHWARLLESLNLYNAIDSANLSQGYRWELMQ
jgi:hypothetical protein